MIAARCTKVLSLIFYLTLVVFVSGCLAGKNNLSGGEEEDGDCGVDRLASSSRSRGTTENLSELSAAAQEAFSKFKTKRDSIVASAEAICSKNSSDFETCLEENETELKTVKSSLEALHDACLGALPMPGRDDEKGFGGGPGGGRRGPGGKKGQCRASDGDESDSRLSMAPARRRGGPPPGEPPPLDTTKLDDDVVDSINESLVSDECEELL